MRNALSSKLAFGIFDRLDENGSPLDDNTRTGSVFPLITWRSTIAHRMEGARRRICSCRAPHWETSSRSLGHAASLSSATCG